MKQSMKVKQLTQLRLTIANSLKEREFRQARRKLKTRRLKEKRKKASSHQMKSRQFLFRQRRLSPGMLPRRMRKGSLEQRALLTSRIAIRISSMILRIRKTMSNIISTTEIWT